MVGGVVSVPFEGAGRGCSGWSRWRILRGDHWWRRGSWRKGDGGWCLSGGLVWYLRTGRCWCKPRGVRPLRGGYCV